MTNENNPEMKPEYFMPFIGQYSYERDNGNKFNQNAVNADRLILTAYNLSCFITGLMGLEALLK